MFRVHYISKGPTDIRSMGSKREGEKERCLLSIHTEIRRKALAEFQKLRSGPIEAGRRICHQGDRILPNVNSVLGIFFLQTHCGRSSGSE